MAFVIKHDRAACIGCGACAAVCSDNWEMKGDGKSAPKKTKLDDAGCNTEAESSCPVSCITVTEE